MRAATLAHRRAERAARRAAAIGEAVADLLLLGPPTHARVAARTGVPLEYLHWAYPRPADLLAAAAQRTPAPPLSWEDTPGGSAR